MPNYLDCRIQSTHLGGKVSGLPVVVSRGVTVEQVARKIEHPLSTTSPDLPFESLS